MGQTYNCLEIKASDYLWLLKDKTLEITNEAILEIDGGFIVYSDKPLEALKNSLSAYTKELQSIFNTTINLTFNEKTCKNEDWIKKYKDSITPISCGDFYIRPSWFGAVDDKIDVIIDPALAFGSGHHATTFCCLEAINYIAKTFSDLTIQSKLLSGKRVLDIGCGSGILSICAKKLGASVWACDTDKIAVESTQENAKKNGVMLDSIILGSLNKLDKEKGSFDIILANILADIIVTLPLGEFIKPQGYLVLSGILDKYSQKVLDKFKDFKVIKQEIKEEWATLILQKF
ncbi:MAG: 50S ribosomal protein L11 methyltransferase [Helicobacter sp.]|nr:50S ribosomal protein L11 methyltransferase [Helicobacteraceae bacterium]MDY3112969.1 50S ribosomal protein L11 methyltransferase [Helicobacter sp.]